MKISYFFFNEVFSISHRSPTLTHIHKACTMLNLTVTAILTIHGTPLYSITFFKKSVRTEKSWIIIHKLQQILNYCIWVRFIIKTVTRLQLASSLEALKILCHHPKIIFLSFPKNYDGSHNKRVKLICLKITDDIINKSILWSRV